MSAGPSALPPTGGLTVVGRVRSYPAAVVGVLGVVARDAALRRIEAAFATFNSAEWATWVAMIVFAYGKGWRHGSGHRRGRPAGAGGAARTRGRLSRRSPAAGSGTPRGVRRAGGRMRDRRARPRLPPSRRRRVRAPRSGHGLVHAHPAAPLVVRASSRTLARGADRDQRRIGMDRRHQRLRGAGDRGRAPRRLVARCRVPRHGRAPWRSAPCSSRRCATSSRPRPSPTRAPYADRQPAIGRPGGNDAPARDIAGGAGILIGSLDVMYVELSQGVLGRGGSWREPERRLRGGRRDRDPRHCAARRSSAHGASARCCDGRLPPRRLRDRGGAGRRRASC